jgi:hypothetical protein
MLQVCGHRNLIIFLFYKEKSENTEGPLFTHQLLQNFAMTFLYNLLLNDKEPMPL